MRARVFELLERCIEDGIRYGINRAHKHTDSPTREQLEMAITQAVLHQVDEWFQFDDVGGARDQ